MAKFKNRLEARKVNETMTGMLCPLKYYCDKETKNYIEVALRILQETEVEPQESEDT